MAVCCFTQRRNVFLFHATAQRGYFMQQCNDKLKRCAVAPLREITPLRRCVK